MLIFPVSGGITEILTYLTPAWATQKDLVSKPQRTTVVDQWKQKLWDVSVLLVPTMFMTNGLPFAHGCHVTSSHLRDENTWRVRLKNAPSSHSWRARSGVPGHWLPGWRWGTPLDCHHRRYCILWAAQWLLRDWSLGDMWDSVLTLQQPTGMILTPSNWRWLPAPSFKAYLDTRSKARSWRSRIQLLFLLAKAPATGPWNCREKIGSFTQVNTEILTVTVQRWRGSGLHPHFRNEEIEEEVRWLVHIGGKAAKNQSVPVFRPGSHLWVESPHPGVTPQYGGCGVHTGPW